MNESIKVEEVCAMLHSIGGCDAESGSFADGWDSAINTAIEEVIAISKTPVGKQSINGIDDGGERMSYGEGRAMREPSEGKGRYDLITPFGLARLAKWYELGAQKYSDRNWEKGMPFSRCIDSAKRHIDKYIMGMKDEDHLSAAVWNLLCIIHFEELGMTDLNDLPCYLYLWQLKPGLEEIKHSPEILQENFAQEWKSAVDAAIGAIAKNPAVEVAKNDDQ